MLSLYWGLFIAGLSLAVISFLLNGVFDLGDFDMGAEAVFLPFRTMFILVFITAFGGSGIIFSGITGVWLAALPSLAIGFFVAKSVDYLLFNVIKGFEKETASEKDAVGLSATVVEKIFPGKIGKISFVADGNIMTGTAKESERTGNGIPKNTVVKIVGITSNIYYVEELDKKEFCKKAEIPLSPKTQNIESGGLL